MFFYLFASGSADGVILDEGELAGKETFGLDGTVAYTPPNTGVLNEGNPSRAAASTVAADREQRLSAQTLAEFKLVQAAKFEAIRKRCYPRKADIVQCLVMLFVKGCSSTFLVYGVNTVGKMMAAGSTPVMGFRIRNPHHHRDGDPPSTGTPLATKVEGARLLGPALLKLSRIALFMRVLCSDAVKTGV